MEISLRSVARVVDALETTEGGGFIVHRPFPTRGLDHFDPFLLLDEMGPIDVAPGQAKGAPDHPHRGFETVTYLLAGEMQHKDSRGNRGDLRPGDVQWMTAGAGVVHSEMPSERFQRSGGRMHGFQLWVNLPRRDKLMPARYQDIPAARIPVAVSDDGKVRVKVIAGEALGARAVIDTRTPITYLHFSLVPGAWVSQAIPNDFNAFAYVVAGEGRFGREGAAARKGQMVQLANDGAEVQVTAGPEPLDFLLIGGQPLGEPVARYGPFVMNTGAEIVQAMMDFRNGRMGKI